MTPVTAVGEKLFGPEGLSTPIEIIAVLSALSLLPAIVLTVTSFVRTIVVLSFIRQGIGSQETPPNQVLIGLAMFLTLFVMTPVMTEIKNQALDPYVAGHLSESQALEKGLIPLRAFMLRHTRQADLALFYNATETALPETPDDVSMRMAIPAYIVSELTTAFQMGVIVLLPFLVVDLAVASVLMSMGMMMVPPVTISLPLKLLLFVLVDGWNLVAGSLLKSYA
ncbi:MAG TPA: flagellar type III secretion system pore protein FliP [Polyangiaceae bacterium]|nr:flagellar type III secretion system pore protein FliP [Polyangiaceae bacterium]